MSDISLIHTSAGLSYEVCNDCGATTKAGETLTHWPTCKPGDGQRWVDYYNSQEDEDVQRANDAVYNDYAQ